MYHKSYLLGAVVACLTGLSAAAYLSPGQTAGTDSIERLLSPMNSR